MTQHKEFEKILNKACSEYERITGDTYPIWRRGHHEMAFDLQYDYGMNVHHICHKQWMAGFHNQNYVGLGSCPVEAIFYCFYDWAVHQPDFKPKEN